MSKLVDDIETTACERDPAPPQAGELHRQPGPGRDRRRVGGRDNVPKRLVRGYLPRELAHQLAQRSIADRITISAAMTAAVEQWVNGTSDRALLFRRLDRLGRAIERCHREAEFHAKAFSVFMHTWLVHTKSVAPADRAAALESAEKRYREIVKQVVGEFADGSRFIDDLPQEPVANDAELDAILATTNVGSATVRR